MQAFKKKVILISSGQTSANPRLVKEATALSAAGYKVTVIYCFLSPWADKYDKLLFKNYPRIQWIGVGYNPIRHKWCHIYARLRRKVYALCSFFFPDSSYLAWRSRVLFSQELEREARKHTADLLIGHNLGALPIVVKMSKRWNAKVGFDAEDFHRGEDLRDSKHWKTCTLVEDAYIPELDYLSAASPLTLEAYNTLYNIPKSLYIRNVFQTVDIPFPKVVHSDNSLNLFWFSQTLGRQRGIELAIRAMGILKNWPISLHLLGNATDEIKQYFISISQSEGLSESRLYFHPVMSQDELVGFASQFDIGLALEQSYCTNRDLCETNKIYTYIIGGLAVGFTDTKAQQHFWDEHQNIGFVFAQKDPESLALGLRGYIENPALLTAHRRNAIELGRQTLNWDIEKQKFLQFIDNLIN